MGHTAEAGRVVSQVGSSFLLLGAYSQLWALLRPFITLQERQGGAAFPYSCVCDSCSASKYVTAVAQGVLTPISESSACQHAICHNPCKGWMSMRLSNFLLATKNVSVEAFVKLAGHSPPLY